MVRVSLHYVEPRRVGYFVLEESTLWLSFLIVAAATARALGRPASATLIAHALVATALVEAALYFASMHDLRIALDDACSGRRLLRALGASTIALGWLLVLMRRSLDAVHLAGWGALCLAALALRTALPLLNTEWRLRTRIFLVGSGRAARTLVREIGRHGAIEVAGFAGPRTGAIAERARAAGTHTIVVATDEQRGVGADELLRCRAEGFEVLDVSAFAARALHRLPIDLLRSSDLIFSDGFARPGWLLFFRRVISVATSLLLLALTLPLLLVASAAIRLDSPGPILFRQARIGLRGTTFSILKFRTMTVGAERGRAQWAKANDPRVTRVGRLLRRFRVDELPQLINVLRGEMELVGPRPERPEFVAELRNQIPYYDLRSLVRPGITGWAQVCYPYAASVEEARDKLQYDLYYVRHLSLLLDAFILLLTAKVVLSGKGAR